MDIPNPEKSAVVSCKAPWFDTISKKVIESHYIDERNKCSNATYVQS